MSTTPAQSGPKWKPLSAIERRVAGVLVEKAKTTPDAYPLTLNAIKVGSNQKNNRFPVTEYDADDIEEALEELRVKGVILEVVGDGRVSKYRHLMYEWLGIDKAEMAVMTELLLRGAQTIGELRGRAARMEPIADLDALRPVLDSLEAKRLIVYLSSAGRGAVLTHNLYQPNELDRLRRDYGSPGSMSSAPVQAAPAVSSPRPAAPVPGAAPASPHPAYSGQRSVTEVARAGGSEELDALRLELEELREQYAELQDTTTRLQTDLDEIKRQLGI